MSKKEDTIAAITKELDEIKKAYAQQSKELKNVRELLELTYQHVSDLNCKVDLNISTLNISTNKSAKSEEKKPRANIMIYFKTKYKEDPDSLSDIIPEEDVDEIKEKYKTELKAKKSQSAKETALIGYIYKDLIRNNKEKLDKLRALKDSEEQNEDVEGEIQEE